MASRPFAVPFIVTGHDAKLWASFRGRNCKDWTAASCGWTDWQPEIEIVLKGVSWSGFENPSTKCVEELLGFRGARELAEYIQVLSSNSFNAVRLPLYAQGVMEDPPLNTNRCGHLSRHNIHEPVRHYNAALRDVVRSLASAGQFVMLDMHSLAGQRNSPTWCAEDEASHCNAANEKLLFDAWRKLAQTLCGEPNIILAECVRLDCKPPSRPSFRT